MSIRSAAFLAVAMTLAPLGHLAAQQAAAPTGTPTTAVTSAPATAPAAVAPAPAVPPPQYSPLYQKSDSAPVLGKPDKNPMTSAGSNHTIVLSTLALILVVVIIVLLVVN